MKPYPPELVKQFTDLPTYRQLSRVQAEEVPHTGREFQTYARERHTICSAVITYQDALDFLAGSRKVSVECVTFDSKYDGHRIRFLRFDKVLSDYYVKASYDVSFDDEYYDEEPVKTDFLSIPDTFDSIFDTLYRTNSGLLFDALTLYRIRRKRGCTHSLSVKYTIRDIADAKTKFVAFGSTLTAYGVYLDTSLMMLKDGDDNRHRLNKYSAYDDGMGGVATVNNQQRVYTDEEESARSVIDTLSGARNTVDDKIEEIHQLLTDI